MDDLRPGDPRTVGRYALSARLGAGGMGQVFLGSSPGGRPVAVKLVHPGLAADAEFRRRFKREVEAARRVGTPACDVFALGAVLAHAVGVRPFGEGPSHALAYRVVVLGR